MKKYLMIALPFCLVFGLTACKQPPASQDNLHTIMGQQNTEAAVSTENAASTAPSESSKINNDAVTTGGHSENLSMVHQTDGLYVSEQIDTEKGKHLVIDAHVSTRNVTGIAQYSYVLDPPKDDLRNTLFNEYFGDQANKAVYDELNNVWELHNSDAIGDYYLYQSTTPASGETVPGEEIFMLEYRAVDLYPFEDNLLSSVSECKASISLEDADLLCNRIIEAITPQSNYIMDTVLPYGTQGRRPYYHIFYRRTVDGMPVTGYNDIQLKVDSSGIQEIKGAIYDLTPQPLSSQILSFDDALHILRNNVNILNFYEKETLPIGAISMEYVVTLTEAQEAVVTPVWRFQIGTDTDSLGIHRRYVLGVDAVTGSLIQGERGMNF